MKQTCAIPVGDASFKIDSARPLGLLLMRRADVGKLLERVRMRLQPGRRDIALGQEGDD